MMIKTLGNISRGLKQDLYLIESMAHNPLFDKKNEVERIMSMANIGETYIVKSRIEKITRSLECIKEYALSEIKGTFYDDHLKEYEGTDAETEYSMDAAYSYILSQWDFHPEPILKDDIVGFVEKHAMLSSSLSFGLDKLLPGLDTIDENGTVKKLDPTEYQFKDNLKAGKIIADICEFNERIVKIKDIAEQKGNLGTIVKLIG